MQDFIVNGLVPGTDIQITFFGWIIISSVLLAATGFWLVLRIHIVRNWIIITSVILSTHRRIKI
jgi:hypothetical protein